MTVSVEVGYYERAEIKGWGFNLKGISALHGYGYASEREALEAGLVAAKDLLERQVEDAESVLNASKRNLDRTVKELAKVRGLDGW